MAQKGSISPLTPAEKGHIFQADSFAALPLHLIGDCALSVEEAAALRWEDVDLDGRRLSVLGRKVPISSETAALLQKTPWQGTYVLPAVRDPKTPINRPAPKGKARRVPLPVTIVICCPAVVGGAFFLFCYNVTVILQNANGYCTPQFLLLRCNRGTTPFDGKAGSDTG